MSGNPIRERVLSGKRNMLIGAALLFSMLFISIRTHWGVVIGIAFSFITIFISVYNLVTTRNRYLVLRAEYVLLYVVLSIFAFFSSLGIHNNDALLASNIGIALVTATSISAVFAGTIYERVKEITIKHRKKMPKELIDLNFRLATYPLLASVIAVFSSIMLLMFVSIDFTFSVLLINLTIALVLLTLIMSVDLLKEDLARELY